MVGAVTSLSWRLLANQLRGHPWRAVLVCLGWSWLLGSGALLAAGMIALRAAPVETAAALVTAVGTVVTVAWLLLPLVLGSEDETLDPVRFALLPLSGRRLTAALVVASLVGAAPLGTVLVAAAGVVTWSRGAGPLAVAVLGVPLAVLTAVLASRALSALAAGVLASRRGREVLGVVLVLALSGAGLLPVLIGEVAVTFSLDGPAGTVLDVLSWTPAAAAWAAPGAAAQGEAAGALGRLAVAVVSVVLLWSAAEWGVERRVRPRTTGRRRSTAAAGPHRLGGRAAGLLPDTPAGAVAARALAYWRRDSRYGLALLGAPVVVLVLVALAVRPETSELGLLLGPALAAMVSLTMVNEFAYDGPSAWVGIAAGPSGRADRAGRHAVVLAGAGPATVAAALAGVSLAGQWELAPAVVGLSATMLLVGLAVSAVASVVWTYPVPEPGANPFSTTSGGSVAALLQQGAATLATTVLVLPILVATVLAFRWPAVGWAVLVVGPVWGAVCLRVGVARGGRRLDERGPELLAALRT
ncbi:MAG: hypothetical protein ACFCVG_02440 [Kineosporiaceae bacterium]